MNKKDLRTILLVEDSAADAEMAMDALGEAHRRLAARFGQGQTYHGANHKGMAVLVVRIVRSTIRPA